ncbi:MAG: CPBP family glutamic-type intramembrane protease [Candidatus Humimicrobiaceae bacterium]
MAALKRSDLKRLRIDIEDKETGSENIKWTLRDMLFSILFLIAVLTGIYFGIARIVIALKIGERINSSNITNLSFSVLYGIQVILMLGVVWFYAIYWRRSRWRDLGLTYYSLIKTIWYSFLALFLIMLINFTYVILMTKVFKIAPPTSKIEELVSNKNVSYIMLLVVVSIIAPICEEIFFRGFLFQGFKKRWGVPAGIIISSALFSAAHLDLYNFLPLLAIGWVLAYLFLKTKSLLPVIFLHAAYNLLLILILLSQFKIN